MAGRRTSDDDVRIVNGYRVRKTTNNPEAELKKWLIGAIPRRHNQAAEEWIAELTAFYKWFIGQYGSRLQPVRRTEIVRHVVWALVC